MPAFRNTQNASSRIHGLGVRLVASGLFAAAALIGCEQVADQRLPSDFTPPESSGRVCEPGATRQCYDGPTSTLDVGPCTSGVQTCQPDGTAYSACEGQVLPRSEDCSTSADDNCDGVSTCGEVLWSRRFGSDRDEVGRAVAYNPTSGDGAVTGFYRAPLDVGGGELPSVNDSRDIFVHGVDAQGEHRWSIGIVGEDHLVSRDIAIGPDGSVAVAATARGFVQDFGLGGIAGKGGQDLLVLAFGADGTPTWASRAGDGANQYPMGVAVDSQGSVIVTGYFRGQMSWPRADADDLVARADDLNDAFVAKFTPAGDMAWVTVLGGQADQYGRAVAVDADDNIVVTGYFNREVTTGQWSLSSGGDDADVFIFGLDEGGKVRFARSLGGDGDARAFDVAIDTQGAAVVTGRYEGSMTMGEQDVPADAAGAIFVAKVDAEGTPVFTKRFGGSLEQGAHGVALDSTGAIIVSGHYEGTPTIGETVLPSSGIREPNIVLFKLQPDGEPVWAKGYDVVGNQDTGYINRGWRRVSVTTADRIVMTGFVSGPLAFGEEDSPEPVGGYDVFLSCFEP